MNDAVLVRLTQPVQELHHDAHRFFRRHRTATNLLRQRQALVIGHDDERLAISSLF